MYAIYGNIYHQYTPNVSIYTIHGSYGYFNMLGTGKWVTYHLLLSYSFVVFSAFSKSGTETQLALEVYSYKMEWKDSLIDIYKFSWTCCWLVVLVVFPVGMGEGFLKFDRDRAIESPEFIR